MISTTPPVAAGPAVRRRPVPWSKLGWVTLRQRRGAMIGAGALLGAFAVYLAVMAVIQNNAYATVAACHPATASKCQQLLQLFTNSYWGGNNSVLQKRRRADRVQPDVRGASAGRRVHRRPVAGPRA